MHDGPFFPGQPLEGRDPPAHQPFPEDQGRRAGLDPHRPGRDGRSDRLDRSGWLKAHKQREGVLLKPSTPVMTIDAKFNLDPAGHTVPPTAEVWAASSTVTGPTEAASGDPAASKD